jgi:hypothetical protein
MTAEVEREDWTGDRTMRSVESAEKCCFVLKWQVVYEGLMRQALLGVAQTSFLEAFP